jgi:SAM-dependent methyltransferase
MSEISNMPELSNQSARMSNPELAAWLASPQGSYVLDWEVTQIDKAVSDIFGFNALQIGLPQCDLLRANRMAQRLKIGAGDPVAVRCSPAALPIANQSIDLVVLPHILEFAADPHEILREVERILIPEGQLIVTGFNPLSLWGVKRRLRHQCGFPWDGNYLSPTRLKDWLKLLGFDVDRGSYGCYAPPCEQQKWLQRWRFAELAGRRWWKYSGAVYMLRAVKRVHGMRLITPNWRQKSLRSKALRPIAQKESHGD